MTRLTTALLLTIAFCTSDAAPVPNGINPPGAIASPTQMFRQLLKAGMTTSSVERDEIHMKATICVSSSDPTMTDRAMRAKLNAEALKIVIAGRPRICIDPTQHCIGG